MTQSIWRVNNQNDSNVFQITATCFGLNCSDIQIDLGEWFLQNEKFYMEHQDCRCKLNERIQQKWSPLILRTNTGKSKQHCLNEHQILRALGTRERESKTKHTKVPSPKAQVPVDSQHLSNGYHSSLLGLSHVVWSTWYDTNIRKVFKRSLEF